MYEKKVFVAADGKEFEDQTECKTYELTIIERIENHFSKIFDGAASVNEIATLLVAYFRDIQTIINNPPEQSEGERKI